MANRLGWKTLVILGLLPVFFNCCSSSSRGGNGMPPEPPVTSTGFYNPLMNSGPDPWVIQQGSNYYFTKTLGNKIEVYQTSRMSTLGQANPVTVWTPPATGPWSHDIWAPEIHFLNNKWYIYFAADGGQDSTHRMYVLESSDATPATTNWTLKGALKPSTDRWAIDGTVLDYQGQLYFIWSGWQGYNQPGQQQLYIARMSDPYTLSGDRVLISQPDYPWEKNGSGVNEGPEILKNKSGSVFLVYSASSCFTDDYCLGLLSLKTGGNPMVAGDWTKGANPVFSKNTGASVFGPGHCSFFKSLDGTQDWIVYHANAFTGQACGDTRSPRMQQFTWDVSGNPVFPAAAATGVKTPPPAGE